MKTKKVLILIILIFIIIIVFNRNYVIHFVSSNYLKISCELKGDSYVFIDDGFYYPCIKEYDDWGKTCDKKDDCRGNCVFAKESLPETYIKNEKEYNIENYNEYFDNLDAIEVTGKCEKYDSRTSGSDVIKCVYYNVNNSKIDKSYPSENIFSLPLCETYDFELKY